LYVYIIKQNTALLLYWVSSGFRSQFFENFPLIDINVRGKSIILRVLSFVFGQFLRFISNGN